MVHDHETALYHFGTDHSESNVHIIRYLRKNTEKSRAWLVCADERSALRTEPGAEKLADMGEVSFQEETLYDYEKRYMDLIASGTQGK